MLITFKWIRNFHPPTTLIPISTYLFWCTRVIQILLKNQCTLESKKRRTEFWWVSFIRASSADCAVLFRRGKYIYVFTTFPLISQSVLFRCFLLSRLCCAKIEREEDKFMSLSQNIFIAFYLLQRTNTMPKPKIVFSLSVELGFYYPHTGLCS